MAQKAADQAKATQRIADAERDYGRASVQYAAARAAQASAEINHFGNLASAAKGFFKQGSTGYKVLEAGESLFLGEKVGSRIAMVFPPTANDQPAMVMIVDIMSAYSK